MTMNDKAFNELKLKATICPGQAGWTAAETIHMQKLPALPTTPVS